LILKNHVDVLLVFEDLKQLEDGGALFQSPVDSNLVQKEGYTGLDVLELLLLKLLNGDLKFSAPLHHRFRSVLLVEGTVCSVHWVK